MATVSVETKPEHHNVDHCSSCGSRHYGVVFYRLEKPETRNGAEYTHIGKCPITGKGILLRKINLNDWH